MSLTFASYVESNQILDQDFFEPGVPPELDLSLDRSSTGSMDRVEVSLTADDRYFN